VIRFSVFAAAALLSAFAAQAQEQSPSLPDSADFIALNKVTARSDVLPVRRGESAEFGKLVISLLSCQRNVSPQQGDGALVDILEVRPDNRMHGVFNGWLFSGSSSLSVMEHPVYDIRLKSCNGGS
jgi:hypothetical protein